MIKEVLEKLISLGYSNEYIFNYFMYSSDDDTEDNTMYYFINLINQDSKYNELQKINEAYIYKLTKGEEDSPDYEKERISKKYIKSLEHVNKPERFFSKNNILKRCYIRELKENATKKGIELENISGDEGDIDMSYSFTMPHFKNPEYQYYLFTIESYSELEELNSICHSLRNKRKLTNGEKEEKAYFEKEINKTLKAATVTDYEKMKLSKCIIGISKLERKDKLSDKEKLYLEKLRTVKNELERKIMNRELPL
ncbi:MAG: hypothetical protein K0R00_2796 [Herbinix sp.]|nr:hypothetical protein [Herbinix sp.]